MFQKITRKNLEKFLEKYSTEEKVLDIGAGGSSYGKFFPNRVTVDIDPNRGPDIVADAHKLPFKDGEFEKILCTEVLEHTQDPFQVERELRRITSKGGILILTTRFVFPLHDVPGDYWRFTKYGLEKIFERWEILELKGETNSFSTVAVLLQRISFQSVLRFNKISKGVIAILYSIIDKMNGLIKTEYGDIGRTKSENQIMPAGYYIVCRKK